MALSIALQPFLSSNVALNGLTGDNARCRGKVAPCPHRRQTAQNSVLLTQVMGCKPFAFFDHFGGRVGGPYADKEVYMVWLNRQFQDVPTFLSTLLLDKVLTVLGDTATKDGFAPLWAPDEVVNDKVDTVFISVIFHVENYSIIDR